MGMVLQKQSSHPFITHSELDFTMHSYQFIVGCSTLVLEPNIRESAGYSSINFFINIDCITYFLTTGNWRI
jgi:hypothetical protein